MLARLSECRSLLIVMWTKTFDNKRRSWAKMSYDLQVRPEYELKMSGAA